MYFKFMIIDIIIIIYYINDWSLDVVYNFDWDAYIIYIYILIYYINVIIIYMLC